MEFQLFLKNINKIQQEKLLGEISHLKMCPPARADLIENINLDAVKPREAAVMMLIYPKNNITHLALILRTSYNGVHSSQVAFPGGKVENFDENYKQTALRETHEEIGIHPDKINVVRDFTPIYIQPSNFMVYPFLGYSDTDLTFIPDHNEVAGIIEFPLSEFLADNTIVITNMLTSYSKNVNVPTFKIQEHYIWGATAMIMSELKDVLKNIF